MESIVSDLIDWMAGVPPLVAYLIIFAIAYGENIVPPVPGDLIVVFGGYLVGLGQLDFVLVVGLATLGGALGFMTMYALGVKLGEALLDPGRFRWLPKQQIGKAQAWLQRWGYGVVALNRFLSGARSVISLTVGMARTPAWPTAAFATLSAAVWTLLITFAGYKVGENWTRVTDFLQRYGQVVLALVVVFIVVQLARAYRARKASSKRESEEG